MLLSMANMNSLSDPTTALRKVASHEPADVARVEFVMYEAMTRRQVSLIFLICSSALDPLRFIILLLTNGDFNISVTYFNSKFIAYNFAHKRKISFTVSTKYFLYTYLICFRKVHFFIKVGKHII